jgi:ElaB/YqjD/DUF883 family membrane-anchored ribosome-binding protein
MCAAKISDDASAEELREQLMDLRNDFKDLMGTVEKLAKNQADGVASHLRDGLQDYVERGEEVLGQARERAEHLYEDLHETVERNPLTALLIALGLGFLIGLLTRSRS